MGIVLGVLMAASSAAEGFRVIGHRGAAGSAPENTLPALERARALGTREVEVDVRLSRDGRLVLYHDGTLDEKTDLSGRVAAHDLATLLAADIGGWFDRTHPQAETRYAGTRLTTPGTAFERFGEDFIWHLEIKGAEPEIPALLVAAIRAAKLEQRAMVTSFDEAQLLRLRALAPGLPLCKLVHRKRRWSLRAPAPSEIESAAGHGFAMVGIAAAELTPALIEQAHGRGLQIRAFGVDSDEDLERAIALGADGATVDHPDRAFAVLKRSAAATERPR